MAALTDVSSGDRIRRVTEPAQPDIEYLVTQVKFNETPSADPNAPKPEDEPGVRIEDAESGVEQFVPERLFDDWEVESL